MYTILAALSSHSVFFYKAAETENGEISLKTERNGFSFIAATPNIAILIDSTKKSPPPTTAVYVVNPKEKRFPLRIEVGYDIYGDITESYYANCNLPRIDKQIHSNCKISTNYSYWPRKKKEAKKFEEDFNAYKKQMMTYSTFISGLYEAFKSFNLNTDCIDSLVEHYVKTK